MFKIQWVKQIKWGRMGEGKKSMTSISFQLQVVKHTSQTQQDHLVAIERGNFCRLHIHQSKSRPPTVHQAQGFTFWQPPSVNLSFMCLIKIKTLVAL